MVTPEEAIEVKCANKTEMTSTSANTVDLKKFPKGAKKCDKFKSAGTSSIGVEPLDDKGLAIVHCNHQVKAVKPTSNKIVIAGKEALAG